MDTIFALATAQGKAGVSIVRISGPDAENALNALSSLAVPVGRPSVRSLVGKDGTHIDEAMVLRFAKPHSFTVKMLLSYMFTEVLQWCRQFCGN